MRWVNADYSVLAKLMIGKLKCLCRKVQIRE
jgi:hypothetical protein